MANLYHYTALRGAELCSGKHGKCTMASAADHYTSREAADAQRAVTPQRKRDSGEHTIPERITWYLVKAMATVFADEVTVSPSAYGVTYGLKSGKIPYQEPFEQLRSEKYVEIAPKRRGEDHHRLSPTPRGMLRLQDARLLSALHTWAATQDVHLTPQEAQSLLNGYRAKTPLAVSEVLPKHITAAAPGAFFTDLKCAVTNLLRLETIALAPANAADFFDLSQYVVVNGTDSVASVEPLIGSSAFLVGWRDSAAHAFATPWSFEVATDQEALNRYLAWALTHPLVSTSTLY